MKAYTRAMQFQEKLVKEYPRDAGYCSDLANMLINLGFLQQGEGKQAEALKTYTRARGIAAKLVAVPSPAPNHRLQMARCCFHRGTLSYTAGQFTEALADLSDSITQSQI